MSYVDEVLTGKERMLASERRLRGAADFMRLIYIRLYGQRKHVNYRLELKEPTEKNGYRFRDFEIRKK